MLKRRVDPVRVGTKYGVYKALRITHHLHAAAAVIARKARTSKLSAKRQK